MNYERKGDKIVLYKDTHSILCKAIKYNLQQGFGSVKLYQKNTCTIWTKMYTSLQKATIRNVEEKFHFFSIFRWIRIQKDQNPQNKNLTDPSP